LQQWSELHDGRLMQSYSRIPGRVLAGERWFAERDTTVELVLKATVQFKAPQNEALYLTLNLFELATSPGFFYYIPLLITTEHLGDRIAYWQSGAFYFYDGIPTTEYLALLSQLLERPRKIVTLTGYGEFKFQTTSGYQTPRFQPNNSSSNSLLFVFQQYLLKNYRRIFPGVNPELRLGLALTEAHFNCVPAILGYFGCRLGDTTEYTLGLLQELVDHQGTGWAVWGRLMANPSADQRAELTRQAETLGRVLAELHREMANIASSDHHSAELDASLLQARIMKLTAAADRELPAVSPDVLRRIRVKLSQISAGIAAEAGLGRMFRVHGDLHLEQVLKTASGWKVIDFEGEPLKTIVEREGYDSPLKDLAAMLRSVSYRVNTVATTMAAEWETILQTALVHGYRAGYDGYQGDFLPADGNFEQLLEFFQLERVIYELSYEAQYRPSWLYIPLAGLERLLAR
jgi:maltokinase